MSLDPNNSVSILSSAHLGYSRDLKSTPTYWSAKSLADAGLLHRLYVLDVEDTMDIEPSLVSTPAPGNKFIPRVCYLFEDYFPVSGRDVSFDLLDIAARRVVGTESILHSLPHFYRTLERAKEKGVTTAVYAPTPHPEVVAELWNTEKAIYGVEESFETSARVKRGYEFADYVLYLSEFARESFEQAGFDSNSLLRVGPLGADLSQYQPNCEANEEFIVLSVANMQLLKGTKYLLEAWDRLNLPNARLVLCGSMTDPVEQMLGPRIEKMDQVEHVGYVSNPGKYYAKASAFVHPSLSEGFGKVIAEAMAVEVPVIVTEHCPREFVDDAGFVVPVRDANAIAEKLRYLHDNPDEARAMGQRGRRIVESNTWQDFSDRVRDAHKTILERGRDQ